jgi:hypothetical protein
MKCKYGMLTPISYQYKNKHHKAIWDFICDCGGRKTAVLSDVKSGRTQSCGCMQYFVRIQNGFLRTIDLEGKKFDNFEVLKKNTCKSFTNKWGASYICKCKCGEIFERKGTKILKGSTKRCRTCQYIFNGKYRERKHESAEKYEGEICIQ